MIAGLALVLCMGAAPGPPGKEKFQALILEEADGTTNMTVLTITVQNWTTDGEAQALRMALTSGGQDGLKNAMWKNNLGFINLQSSFGWPINVARVYPLPNGGQQILVGTARPIGYMASMQQQASTDYQFGMIELVLDASGRGTGQIIGAATVSIDANGKLNVNPYTGMATKLQNVRRLK